MNWSYFVIRKCLMKFLTKPIQLLVLSSHDPHKTSHLMRFLLPFQTQLPIYEFQSFKTTHCDIKFIYYSNYIMNSNTRIMHSMKYKKCTFSLVNFKQSYKFCVNNNTNFYDDNFKKSLFLLLHVCYLVLKI